MFNNTIGLLRTNPKLSTNAKLIVDSSQNLYLGAFKANATLSQERYQKWATNSSHDWSTDLSLFFDTVRKEERFQVLEKYPLTSVFNSFEYQYEDQYQYGARYNDTKLFDEQYTFLAPIWIDGDIPKRFIIYRVNDVDYPLDVSLVNVNRKIKNNKEWNQNDKVLDLLEKATIIKTFDMERDSNLGEYLYRHFANDALPFAPISFNFHADRGWSFNGIDIMNGGFVSKREYKSEEYIAPQNLEIYSNRFITNGFERNGVASSNLINLEFMFDDPEAKDYEAYRYFGLFVDPIYEGQFELDKISNGVFIPNLLSVDTVYDTWNQAAMLPTYEFTPSGGELPLINWVQDKNLEYCHIQNNKLGDFKVALNNRSEDFFTGKGKTGKRIKILEEQDKLTNFLEIKFEYAPNDWDRYFIGIHSEFKNGEARVNDYFLLADPTLPAGSISENRFSNQGTLKQITRAFSAIISSNDNPFTFKTKLINNGLSILVYDYAAGFNKNAMLFGISTSNYNLFNDSDGALQVVQGILFNETLPSSANSDGFRIYTPIGGASGKRYVLISSTEINNIKVGEYLKILGKDVFCKVLEIVKSPDEDFYRIILDKPYDIKRLDLEVYEDYRVKWGKFSAYDLSDFNFDFYDTSNSDLLELGYEIDENENSVNFQKLIPILKPDNPDDDLSLPYLNSEYDRLYENELTETAILSRVVPWITKFRMKNAINSRNLPYILNTNEAFGESNLSPSLNNLDGRNIQYYDMEYFNIFDVPTYLMDKDIQSYINFDNTTEDLFTDILKNIESDKFEQYFHRTGQIRPNNSGTSNEWIDNKTRHLYSKIDFGSTAAHPYTVFRGLRYIYKQRKENEAVSPVDFIQTTSVNDYKFSVVSRVIQDEEATAMSKIKVVKNEKWKFICIYIEITIPPYSANVNIDRNWFYTANDIEGNTPLNVSFLWQTIDPSGEDLILEASSLSDPNFFQTITKDEKGNFYPIYITWEEGGDTYVYSIQPLRIINDFTIEINGAPEKVSGPLSAPITIDNPYDRFAGLNLTYSINDSGQNRLKSILDDLNASKFAARFNQFESIEYVTVNENGTETLDDFVIEIQDGTSFNKVSNLSFQSDPNRPAAYQLASGEIGKRVIDYDDAYVRRLKRMNGEYTPLFKDVITFTDIYNEQKRFELDEYILDQDGYIDAEYIIKYFDWIVDPTRRALIYQKFKRKGISFASHKEPYLENYGFINNYFFHKANERTTRNILRLSESTDKLPLYPKISEIAIDKKRLNTLDSNWSNQYFTRALKGGNFKQVPGTLNPIENSSFFASTIMKVLNEYTLNNWTVSQAPSALTLDIIRFSGNTSGVHWAEDSKQIWADFYLDQILFENISNDVLSFFNRKVDTLESYNKKDTLIDDVEVYVKRNIATRFFIDNVEVWSKEATDIESNFIASTETLPLTGFSKITPTIQNFSNKKLGFRLIYNKRKDYNYQFQVFIKIRA